MQHLCPACQRAFDEPGFCPYDGKQLVASSAAAKPTVLSAFVEAQSDPDARTLDAPPPPDEPTHQVRAISASDSTSAAIDSFKERINEYDRLVGETLDSRYYVQRKIGEGGMGVVFAARHAVIERPLAIKVLKREVMRDQATIRRFVQEAKAASRIGHPNIVDVTDFGTTPEGMTYSVMEYVDGQTLSKAIKHSAPFPGERAVPIAQQIARALHAAHQKGIVHRDLKPENVFLIDRDGRADFVKIVDFGIAKVAPQPGADAGPRLTRAGAVFGTPEYMAPEQAAGRSDTDHRVDVYALGTIMYEMLVGRVPHKADSMVRTLAMQMLDPITPPLQVNPELAIPKSLELLVMKCLVKDREKRIPTMTDVLAELDKIQRELEQPEEVIPLIPAVPPGADPAQITANEAAPRRAKPQTKQLHEPEFVTSDRPLTFNLPADDTIEPRPMRKWPLLLLAMLLLGGGAAGVFLAMKPSERVASAPADAASVPASADAALVVAAVDAASSPPDATVVAQVPVDAGGRTVRDAGAGMIRVDPRRKVRIQVLTRPAEAEIWVKGTYRGPTNTTLEEDYGTAYTVVCKAPHMAGRKFVLFDGKVDSIMCTAVRIPVCAPGLKPFPGDPECEEAPSTMPSPLDNP